MGRTMDVARDRAHNASVTVMPVEVARGVYVKNPPGLRALKLLFMLIGQAGDRLGDDVSHQIRLADIRRYEGMKSFDRPSMVEALEELSATVLTHDDRDKRMVTIGGVLDEASVDYRDEADGNLLVTWTFRRAFQRMAAQSDYWAILDRQTVFHLRSQYAVLLFQHLSSLFGLDRVTSKTFSVDELRAVFGVEAGKLERFSNLNQRVLQPALAEVNRVAPFEVTAQQVSRGRTITGVTISWKPIARNPAPERSIAPAAAKAERPAAKPTSPPQARPVAFPAANGIAFTPPFAGIAREAGIMTAQGSRDVADAFRAALREAGMPLDAPDIADFFADFCGGWEGRRA